MVYMMGQRIRFSKLVDQFVEQSVVIMGISTYVNEFSYGCIVAVVCCSVQRVLHYHFGNLCLHYAQEEVIADFPWCKAQIKRI